MSLIEEALRRVQGPPAPPQATPPRRKREEPVPHSWPVGEIAEGSTARPVGRPRSLMPLLTIVAVLAIVLWAVGAMWVLRDAQQLRAAAKRAAPPPAVPLPAPASPAEALPSMVLSGVVVGAGEPYAVIDGRIVSAGESIGEAMVVQITPRVVTLRRADGSRLELSVPR